MPTLHRFRDIAYFPKFKDVTWPWPRPLKGQFVIPVLNRHMANQCTKYDSSSHSWDMYGASKIESKVTTPFQGRFVVSRLGLTTFHLCTNFKVASFTHYEDTKGNKNAKMGVVYGLVVIQCHRQHCHSIDCIRVPIRSVLYVCSSVFFHSNFWTDWPLTSVCCGCMGDDKSSQGIGIQGYRSKSIGSKIPPPMQNTLTRK